VRAHQRKWGLLFAAPGAVFFGAFAVYPFLDAFWVSLVHWNFFGPATFVGLSNYVSDLTDPTFWTSLYNTVLFLVATYIPANLIGIGLALFLNLRFPLRDLYRTLFYVPAVTSQVVVAVVWLLLYNQQGPLNALLADVHLGPVPWLFSNWAMPAIILMTIWASIGYFTILYLAGLQGIPLEVKEAARSDGASPLRSLLAITLPLLRSTVTFCLIMSVVQGMTVFIPELLLTNGGPNNDTMVLSLLVYQDGFVYRDMGPASAIAVIIFVLIMGTTVVSLRRVGSAARSAA
jgi:multiple sugar transport system permease protein